MKKYFYLLVIVLTINIVNTSNSQTFPDINNDTTYLYKVPVKEGERTDVPLYMDTTGLNGLEEYMLFDVRYYNRFYSKYGIKLRFTSKYFINNKPDVELSNYNTQNIEVVELLNNLKDKYGKFYLKDFYDSVNTTGSDFYFSFDSIVNVLSVYDYLIQNKQIVNSITQVIFPHEIFNIKNSDSDTILIIPNPSSDYISLDLGGLEVADLSIYDMIGNKIMTIPNYSNKTEIDVSNLSIGTYFLNFNFQSYKFIKE